MSWRDLLSEAPETRVLPWVGGRRLADRDRRFQIVGTRPPEHGWHAFRIDGSRRATWEGPAEPDVGFGDGRIQRQGYLVGNRLIPDGAAVVTDPSQLVEQTLAIHLVEPGLPRFTRARVARGEGGHWVYLHPEFPLGPEPDVQTAFVDDVTDLSSIPAVSPALELAFRFCRWQREEAARRREEAEQRRLAREAARVAEARRQEAMRSLGTGLGRRRLATTDFEAAARAALGMSGASYLDHRAGVRRTETVVQFRFRGRRFECVVDTYTLRVIDSGICLVDHRSHERGDDRFTLESLPAVIDQAIREHRLVVFRHVN